MNKLPVLDHGFVKSLWKIEAAFAHGYTVDVDQGIAYGLSGQILSGQKTKAGHLVVTLQTPGFGARNESVLPVHQLIAYAKYGREAFRSGLEIRHLNNQPDDNRGDNLAPGTRLQNILDIPKEQRKKIGIARTRHLVGRPNCNRKLSDADVQDIRSRGVSSPRGIITELSKEYEISHSVISMILSGGAYASVQ